RHLELVEVSELDRYNRSLVNGGRALKYIGAAVVDRVDGWPDQEQQLERWVFKVRGKKNGGECQGDIARPTVPRATVAFLNAKF
ncbi:hypothetical protein scyTo_0026285, partial [Scyliorhinus torazame]|nr:hypothetical protein [Scyliorhinus torazame]